jgi:hypothetical protein
MLNHTLSIHLVPRSAVLVIGFAFFALSMWAAPALAGPTAVAVQKVGSCPSGYSTSGDYCNPGASARYAVEKVGSCPSEYSTSGAYCLASSDNSRHAMAKTGSCPSGYSTSGAYCLSSH